MGIEIDFLAVGDKSKSGDAIAIRLWNSQSANPFVITIDGGTEESGEAVVEHVKSWYGTTTVNLAIASHLDADHVSGMRSVVRDLDVRRIWMHRPWEQFESMRELFKTTAPLSSVKPKLKKAMALAAEVESIALSRASPIPIDEPFAPQSFKVGAYGSLALLSPTAGFYRKLLAVDDRTPTPSFAGAALGAGLNPVNGGRTKRKDTFYCFPGLPIAFEDTDTKPSNNLSLVFTLSDRETGKTFLFTGDAGRAGLRTAIANARSMEVDLGSLWGMQIPHHGSHRNVNHGLIHSFGATWGVISVAASSEDHPSQRVVNTCINAGMKVCATMGKSLLFTTGQMRSGYLPVSFLEFKWSFED